MFNISTTGHAKNEWCSYRKVVPFGNGNEVARIVVACPVLASHQEAGAQSAYETAVGLFSQPDPYLHDNDLLVKKLVQLTAIAGGHGNGSPSLVPMAIGVFTAAKGVIASTGFVSAFRAVPQPVSRLATEAIRATCTGKVTNATLLTLKAENTLSAVVLSPDDLRMSPDLASRVLETTTSSQGVVKRLCLWASRSGLHQPLTMIGFGKVQDDNQKTLMLANPDTPTQDITVTHPGPREVPDGTPAEENDRLVRKVESLCSQIAAVPNDLVQRIGPLTELLHTLKTLQEFPATELVRRLLDELDALEKDRDFERARPLWTALINLWDMTEDAQASADYDIAGLLHAIGQTVLNGLASVGVEPFRETGTTFNPRTQECIRIEPVSDSRNSVLSLRCGFRRGDRVLRREKVILRQAQHSDSKGDCRE